MDTSAMIHVPWVGYAMAGLAAVTVAGLTGVVLGQLAARDRAQSASAAQATSPAHGPAGPITPEWLERLITGAGLPPGPRPTARPPERPERDVA